MIQSQRASHPLVSLVIPAYNCAPYIDQCLQSILQQTYTNLEIIVIDDASTDDTLLRIQEFQDKRIRVLRNTTNQGYLKTANVGLKAAQGELIGFQDADDWSAPNRIACQTKALLENDTVMLCGTSCVKYYSTEIQHTLHYPTSDNEIRLSLSNAKTPLFCANTALFRKEILKAVGFYDEIFDRIGSEDTDWYIRIIEKHKAMNLDKPLYYWRQHSSSFVHSDNSNSLKNCSLLIALALHHLRAQGFNTSKLTQTALRELLIKPTDKKVSVTAFQKLLVRLSSHQHPFWTRCILRIIWHPLTRSLLGLHRKKKSKQLAEKMKAIV